MHHEEKSDPYRDYYAKCKLSLKELRQFPEFADVHDEELMVIADRLFELAILAQKIY